MPIFLLIRLILLLFRWGAAGNASVGSSFPEAQNSSSRKKGVVMGPNGQQITGAEIMRRQAEAKRKADASGGRPIPKSPTNKPVPPPAKKKIVFDEEEEKGAYDVAE
jgi:hypothetical protein